jgi:hypothetical protein
MYTYIYIIYIYTYVYIGPRLPMASAAQGGKQHLGNALFEQAQKFSKVTVLVYLLCKIKYSNGIFSVVFYFIPQMLSRPGCVY